MKMTISRYPIVNEIVKDNCFKRQIQSYLNNINNNNNNNNNNLVHQKLT